MKLYLDKNIGHILVLGAGASVDYGLPTWKELSTLIRKKIQNDKETRYTHKKEILEWMDKVDKEGKYKTIDECIKEESVSEEYHSTGSEIENQVFEVIKDVFTEKYNDTNSGWIRTLNEKILSNRQARLEKSIAFVNYNYDSVLDKNFLDFTYLPEKRRRYIDRNRLDNLEGIVVPALFPHGNVFSDHEVDSSSIKRYLETMKSNDPEHLDVVSCFESNRHEVGKYEYGGNVKLYILGLGEGLRINLDNIEIKLPISEIHVTIMDSNLRDIIIKFLSEKYSIPTTEIKVYPTCNELIEECFND